MIDDTDIEDVFPIDTNRMSIGTLDKWLILSHLKESLASTISIAYVFDKSGNNVILVTKDDEVMSFGFNKMLLGLGSTNSSLEPQTIDCLCQKGVFKLAFGDQHVVAIITDKSVWTWGQNTYCEGKTLTPKKVSGISGEVVDIASGPNHVLALTSDGQVYAWGQNRNGQLGLQDTSDKVVKPTLVKVVHPVMYSPRVEVNSIACGQMSSVALSRSGEVFVWGYGSHIPRKVHGLDKVVIEKVVCGSEHTLMLSTEKLIYGFGNNKFGQLATGSPSDTIISTPVQIASQLGPFVDIGATNYNHLSAALSKNGNIYMWGQCRGISIASPMEVGLQTIDDVFAAYGTPSVTFRALRPRRSGSNRLLDSSVGPSGCKVL